MREGDRDYPSREELREFLEAHRKGGKDAILELLRKNREEARSPSEESEAPKATDKCG